VTALYDVVTDVYDCLENKEKINLILYDFSNAFGCLVLLNLNLNLNLSRAFREKVFSH
jgi:hypothetical protein